MPTKTPKPSHNIESNPTATGAKVRAGKGGKALLALWCLWVALLPWMSGGREMAAVLISYSALILGLFLIWRLPKGKSIGEGYLKIASVLLTFWVAASLLWSINRYQTLKWLVFWSIAVAAFLLAYRLQDSLRMSWLRGYLIIANIFSLYGFWLFVTEPYERLTASFFWPNPMAAFLLPAVLVSAWLFARGGGRLYLLSTAIVAAAFVLTYSRGAWLMLLLVVIIMLARAVRQREGRWFWYRLLMVIIAAALVVQAVLALRTQKQQAGIARIDSGSRIIEVVGKESVSRDDRIYFNISALQIWAEHPVAGTGAGTYASIHPQYQIRVISAARNAHNFYLQTLSELGAVGLMLLLAVLCGLVVGVVRSLKGNPEIYPLALGLIALLLHSGVDINSEYPALWVLVATLGGLMYKPPKLDPQEATAKYPVWGLALLVLLLQPTIDLYQSEIKQDWGDISREEGNLSEAARYYREAHVGLAYNPDTWLNEGIIYYTLARQGTDPELNLQLARERAQTASQLDPYDAQHPFLLARTLYYSGDKAGAESAYRQALGLDPFNNPSYYADLADLYLDQGNLDAAAMVAKQGLDLYTEQVIANRHAMVSFRQGVAKLEVIYAQVNLAKNKVPEALALLQKALVHDPGNSNAKQLMSQITGRPPQ